MSEDQDPTDDAVPPFDEFLDRFLRGEAVEPREFIDSHPTLSDGEREQIRSLGAPASGGAGVAAAPPSDSPPIAQIAGFRLIRKIGAGASGAVYLAEDLVLGRTVAVKLLGPDLLGKGERAERFSREARAVASLRHPNIVTVHAAGEESGLRYLAMEYLPGSGLDEVLDRASTEGTLPPARDVVRWGLDLARALACAHDQGIVHRDLKPSNVRIADDGRAVLLDFGIARAENAATLTQSGEFRGSPQYASPEQVGIENVEVGPRSDLYSLGVTLYELVTGVAPFRAQTREQLFHEILVREPVAPRKLEPSVPADLETLLLGLLEKDPARRPAPASLVAADLEAIRDGRPISTRRISPLGRLARWARRSPAKAALALALALGIPVIAALGGYIAANQGKIDKAAADERAAVLAEVLERGFLEYGEGDSKLAIPIFREALELEPTSAEAKAGLALAIMDDDPAGAIAFLDADGAAAPPGSWRSEIRAEGAARAQKIRRGLDSRPETRSGGTRTAIDYFVTGIIGLRRVHEGEDRAAGPAFNALYSAVLQSPSPTALYHHELGHAAYHANRHVEARAIAAAIRSQWPGTPNTLLAAGRALINADPEAAFAALTLAARNPPRGVASQAFIVSQLGGTGRSEHFEVARALGERLLAQYPSEHAVYQPIAAMYRRNGDLDLALHYAREAMRVSPRSTGSASELAGVLIARGEYAEALEPARMATGVRPRYAPGWNALGICEINRRHVDAAVKAFEKADELNPRDAYTLCNLGRALWAQGDFAGALARIEEGHRLGSRWKGWTYDSKKMLDEVRNSISLEERLDDLRRGEDMTAGERAGIAHSVSLPKRRYAEATAIFKQAFLDEPQLRTDTSPDYLGEAVAAAAAAGLGHGADAPADLTSRAGLLAEARGWIRAMLEGGDERRLTTWLGEPSIAATKTTRDRMETIEAGEWKLLWERLDPLSPPAPAARPWLNQ